MKAKTFETQKVMLNCAICGACPAVEITPDVVTIGEEGNIVRLSHAQWNDLVARVLNGELSAVP